MVERKYDREKIDRQARQVLRQMVANGQSYVKSQHIREQIGLPHQAVRPTLERLREQGDIERWQDSQPVSGSSVYQITLENDCGRCGASHSSMSSAIRCCDELFDQPTATGSRTIRGPSPDLVEASEGGEQR